MVTKILTLLFCTICLVTPYEEAWVDYRNLKHMSEILKENEATTLAPDSSYCKTEGFNCKDCDTRILCYKDEGKWAVYDEVTENCKTAQPNLPHCVSGKCVGAASRDCLDVPNKCRKQEGIYPDPGNCQNFYYCVPDSSTLKLFPSGCTGNFSYNSRTTYCDKPLATGYCSGYPVPECASPGQTGALTENPTIFFTCLPVSTERVLYPFLDACKNGKKYDTTSKTCK